MVKDGRLLTPEGRNILRGISRKYILEELAPQMGIGAAEKNLELYDLANADEAFFTGTPFCILPITSVNGTRIGAGTMGPTTRSLIERWGQNVGVDIIEQIKRFGRSRKPGASGAPSPYSFKTRK